MDLYALCFAIVGAIVALAFVAALSADPDYEDKQDDDDDDDGGGGILIPVTGGA